MPIDNPAALVAEFKKSGEFDRLRRELLARFQQDESYPEFKEGLEDIARKRLVNEPMLHYLGPDWVLKELAQEIQRYPIVERAVSNVRTFSDPAFLASMQKSMHDILHEEKAAKSSAAVTTKDVPESHTTRTQVTESIANQSEKIAQDAHQGDMHPEHEGPVVTNPTGSPLDSPLTEPPKPTLAQNLNEIASVTTANEENDTRRDGSSVPTDPHPESNDITSQPSSSAHISNVNPAIEDQHQPTTDIEMADIETAD